MTPTIVVLGGGYTGVISAVRLARRTRRAGARVILVNPSDRFTERLRLHQLAAGQPLAGLRIPALLDGGGAEFVRGRATRIDAERREVHVEDAGGERLLAYDYLVYAVGAVTDTGTVPGVDAHAYTLDGPEAAGRLAGRLAELTRRGGGTVAVAGSGLTGVEAAAEIAESHPGLRVVLLGHAEPGSMMGHRARRYLRRALDRLGVEVRAGVEITKVLPDAVELGGGELVPADACLWTAGVVAAPLAREAGLTVDARGRVVVDATLASVSHPSVYAVGDAAAVRQGWGEIHGTCQSGIPAGMHAADAIARRLRGKKPRPFRFGYFHQPVSLGRRDAVIQFTRPDDSPGPWHLTGRAAVAYKEAVTSSPAGLYRLSRRTVIPIRLLSRTGGRANRPAAGR
ncbi:NADH dehydrogenase FAD-containing subunit [Thermocatellispora tengchongensis]|uniref:NADH dehydrogenase FAD-containing subunit n=1 Tax=Thermocatellispora tengchongensis TaxID=1073253 RepID=A0A840P2G6_9ACTN|nr:FAD-dependent oxidoreductase [Thermocatellispora tengchongensis]MBB5133552.1 NADH dehydrogenase FAD-containing subunit [Thermocatellispora tengchongensis]